VIRRVYPGANPPRLLNCLLNTFESFCTYFLGPPELIKDRHRQSAFFRLCIFVPFFTFFCLVALQWKLNFSLPFWVYFLWTVACLLVVPVFCIGNALDLRESEHTSYRDLDRRNFFHAYIYFCRERSKICMQRAMLYCVLLTCRGLWVDRGSFYSVICNDKAIFYTKYFLCWIFFTCILDGISRALKLKSERNKSFFSVREANYCPPFFIAKYWKSFTQGRSFWEKKWVIDETEITPWYILYPYKVLWFWLQFFRIRGNISAPFLALLLLRWLSLL